MKNLIEEIEKIIEDLKNELGDIEYDRETRIEIETYKYILSILNQYNIITAPKSIKLSEIVEKLKDYYLGNENIFINRNYHTTTIKIKINFDTFEIVSINPKTNNIDWLNRECFTRSLKWLYTLWIADTQIIDDLKENE